MTDSPSAAQPQTGPAAALARRALTVSLLAFVAASLAWMVCKEVRARRAAGGAGEGRAELTVYYFHATARCPTCNRMEALVREVLQRDFAADMAAGRIEFVVLNREEPRNAAYVERFALSTNSLILVRGGEAGGAHRNLGRIWELIGEEDAFVRYVSSELTAALGAR